MVPYWFCTPMKETKYADFTLQSVFELTSYNKTQELEKHTDQFR